jgi:serine/threonine protein kinase
LTIPNAVRTVLLQIASGIKHLHGLRIVHRALRPANILLADSHKSKRKGDMQESVFEIFSLGDYVAKISDMGLCKQLMAKIVLAEAPRESLRYKYKPPMQLAEETRSAAPSPPLWVLGQVRLDGRLPK